MVYAYIDPSQQQNRLRKVPGRSPKTPPAPSSQPAGSQNQAEQCESLLSVFWEAGRPFVIFIHIDREMCSTERGRDRKKTGDLLVYKRKQQEAPQTPFAPAPQPSPSPLEPARDLPLALPNVSIGLEVQGEPAPNITMSLSCIISYGGWDAP